MFETTLPAIDPRTTFGSASEIAISAMISSGALPNVALRKPPMPGPVCSAVCSVDSPISHASGMSDTADSTNNATFPGEATTSSRSVMGATASDAHRSRRATSEP